MTTVTKTIKEEAEAIREQLVEWRRSLHRRPELSFEEYETSAFIKQALAGLQHLTVYSGREETGLDTAVIAELGAGDGPLVILRADIDALPIQEENDCDYASTHEGKMHACGHDAHTAMLLGACVVLHNQQEHLNGTIRFIFQPAEEDTDEYGSTGSPYLISRGWLEGAEAAFALHMDPEFTPGHVRLQEGPSMAGIDTFEGVIRASGGHGAYPHLATDPVWISTFVMQAMQGIVSRRTSPLEPAVVSIGELKAGASTNVIPDEVRIRGTMRSYSDDTRKHLREELQQAFRIAESMNASQEVTIAEGEPALVNSPVAVKAYRSVLKELYPETMIHEESYGMGGEDFSYMARQVPSCMMFLGAGYPDRADSGLHMPQFDIEETILPIGASLLAGAAVHYMTKHKTD
jgi:amidohydrolase